MGTSSRPSSARVLVRTEGWAGVVMAATVPDGVGGGGGRARGDRHTPRTGRLLDIGLTKGEPAEYYRRIAPNAVPHLRGRPLTMQIYPDGANGRGVFVKERRRHFPDWVGRVEVPRRNASDLDAHACRLPRMEVLDARVGARHGEQHG